MYRLVHISDSFPGADVAWDGSFCDSGALITFTEIPPSMDLIGGGELPERQNQKLDLACSIMFMPSNHPNLQFPLLVCLMCEMNRNAISTMIITKAKSAIITMIAANSPSFTKGDEQVWGEPV